MSKQQTATAAKKADETTALQVVPKAEQQPQTPTLQDRITQVLRQASLVDQLDKLNGYRRELDSFKFGADGTRAYLKISDGNRDFTTSKQEHLELVITDLISLIDKRIEETQAELLAAA